MRTGALLTAAFACSSPAWAAVVYVPNGHNLWSNYDPMGQPQPPPRDVNSDGVLDLGFGALGWNWVYSRGHSYTDYSTGGSGFSTAPMSVGTVVGPSSSFNNGIQLGVFAIQFDGDSHFSRQASLSIPEGDSYWGLKFAGPGGAVSYGWLRYRGHMQLIGDLGGDVTVDIIDYAYETQTGVPITIPAPAGLVVVGGLGLVVARRGRRSAVQPGKPERFMR